MRITELVIALICLVAIDLILLDWAIEKRCNKRKNKKQKEHEDDGDSK